MLECVYVIQKIKDLDWLGRSKNTYQDIWDKLPREEKIESMLRGLQKYDLESGVDNANLEH